MRKVLVIGSGGAGKSTFASKLSKRTGLPLIHLDSLYWRPGWIETSTAEWDQTIEHLLGRDTWIMDGNYGRTLERRLAACDTVIFLDLPLWQGCSASYRGPDHDRFLLFLLCTHDIGAKLMNSLRRKSEMAHNGNTC